MIESALKHVCKGWGGGSAAESRASLLSICSALRTTSAQSVILLVRTKESNSHSPLSIGGWLAHVSITRASRLHLVSHHSSCVALM